MWHNGSMPYWFDGNNLIGLSADSARAQPQARASFLAALSAYYKSGGGRFLVYFDGDDPGESMPPAGVRVRYSAPLSADDAIVGRLHEIRLPAEVIVVSNDRSLQSRCRGAGSRVMDWKQFTLKMESRKLRLTEVGDYPEPVNVEDWIKYFGLNKK
ncbi:MAG: NYN domain-containing protein [Acidobacteria bacterium]|nr:NYN domain-containing protein [Acidobacteriota bacterium]